MDYTSDKIDKIIDALPKEVYESLDMMCYGYILSKALAFIDAIPKEYAASDAYGEPNESLTKKDLDLLKNVCAQITEGKGLTIENPIDIEAVSESYNLIRLFHFQLEHRKSNYGVNGVVDAMTIKHISLGKTNNSDTLGITLFFRKNR
jgi:hypothetical protein